MSSQTVRYARNRVQNDPDRDNDVYTREGTGRYTGSNMTTLQMGPGWMGRIKSTRGAYG